MWPEDFGMILILDGTWTEQNTHRNKLFYLHKSHIVLNVAFIHGKYAGENTAMPQPAWMSIYQHQNDSKQGTFVPLYSLSRTTSYFRFEGRGSRSGHVHIEQFHSVATGSVAMTNRAVPDLFFSNPARAGFRPEPEPKSGTALMTNHRTNLVKSVWADIVVCHSLHVCHQDDRSVLQANQFMMIFRQLQEPQEACWRTHLCVVPVLVHKSVSYTVPVQSTACKSNKLLYCHMSSEYMGLTKKNSIS